MSTHDLKVRRWKSGLAVDGMCRKRCTLPAPPIDTRRRLLCLPASFWQAWLQTRGADLTGAIERHDLEEIARAMQDSGPPGHAEVGQGGAAQD
jgi:hypothetical protein